MILGPVGRIRVLAEKFNPSTDNIHNRRTYFTQPQTQREVVANISLYNAAIKHSYSGGKWMW